MTAYSSEAERKLSEYSKLVEEIGFCRKCDLWTNRIKPVIGEGTLDTAIMIVGLGPGRQENMEGKPFIGVAGRFLDKVLSFIGIERGEVYITNIVKCYPPGNRVYRRHIESCTPYLEKQLKIVEPAVILVLGSVAAAYFSEKYKVRLLPINRMHGVIVGIDMNHPRYIIPMYHPASACYNPGMRDIILEDWRRVTPLLRQYMRVRA
jgi:DNA polymerase